MHVQTRQLLKRGRVLSGRDFSRGLRWSLLGVHLNVQGLVKRRNEGNGNALVLSNELSRTDFRFFHPPPPMEAVLLSLSVHHRRVLCHSSFPVRMLWDELVVAYGSASCCMASNLRN